MAKARKTAGPVGLAKGHPSQKKKAAASSAPNMDGAGEQSEHNRIVDRVAAACYELNKAIEAAAKSTETRVEFVGHNAVGDIPGHIEYRVYRLTNASATYVVREEGPV